MEPTRRGLLAGAALAGASIGVARATGSTAAETGTASARDAARPPAGDGWPMLEGDAENSGAAPPGRAAVDTPRVAGTTAAGSSPSAAPVCADGTLYVATREAIVALSTADGDERWRFETDANVWSSFAASDGALYVAGQGETTYALGRTGMGAMATADDEGAGDATPAGSARRAGGPLLEEVDWLSGWVPLFVGLVGVPMFGSLTLGALVALVGREDD